jgi:hypothetical protein
MATKFTSDLDDFLSGKLERLDYHWISDELCTMLVERTYSEEFLYGLTTSMDLEPDIDQEREIAEQREYASSLEGD